MWPQITIIVLWTIHITAHLVNHGKPRTGNFSFWWALVNIGGLWYIYNAGGFFNNLK